MSAPRRMSRKRPKHKPLKLTPEQKKAIWAKPDANAGAGWHSRYEDDWTHDPIEFEEGKKR